MNTRRGRRSSRPWYVYLLGLAAAVIIVLGIREIGAPTSSARVAKEVVAAERGVVQVTVSGTGNVEPGVDEQVNFATSGTLAAVGVKVGQQVKKGQLIASLDPSAAKLTLQEAQDQLTAARDNLTSVEDGDSASSNSGGSGGAEASAAAADGAEASAASVNAEERARDDGTGTTTTTPTPTSTTPTSTTPTITTPTTTATTPTTTTGTTTATTPARTTPGSVTTTTPVRTTPGTRTGSTTTSIQNTPGTGTHAGSATKSAGSSGKAKTGTAGKTGGKGASTKAATDHNLPVRTATSTTTVGATTTAARSTPSPSEIAQAQASVDSAEATVASDQKAVKETKLYAPVSGTVASLAGDAIGQTISSGGSGNGANGSDAAATNGSDAAATNGSATADSSSAGFATVINSKAMTMTVSLSEDDISSVRVGQVATISIDALTGVELGAHVTAISPLGSSSDGVTSYEVTLTTSQANTKVLPGMSATATIVTAQAQGVTVPTEAVTGSGSNGDVELDRNGKVTTQAIVVGLRGSSRAVVVSGVKAGQDVQISVTLPALGTTTTTTTSSSGTTGSGGFGSGGFFGGGGGFFGGGGARAFLGGGGGGG